jgi:FKBP-type peptidyl-prolyl cis-trans isomerase FklB
MKILPLAKIIAMLKTLFTSLLIILVGINFSTAQENLKTTLNNDIDSLSYSLGLLIGHNLRVQGVEKIQHEVYTMGLQDGFSGKPDNISFEAANIFVQKYFENKMAKASEENLNKGIEFLNENKNKEGVVTLSSGLQYKVLRAGEGKSPKATDRVKVHYKGTLLDGTVFDSSYERGEPSVFGVKQVIKGWTEALMLMSPGSKWMLYVPPDLAYGSNSAGEQIGPNSTLIFEVELIEVLEE